MAGGDVLDDGEPKPGPALFPAHGSADPIEALCQSWEVLGRDAGTIVDDAETDNITPRTISEGAAQGA